MSVNSESIEFEVKCQADELLKAIRTTFETSAKAVEIEAEDSEKMEITANAISPDTVRQYKTFKVTATITPIDDGDIILWSRVKWNRMSEKNPNAIDGELYGSGFLRTLKTFEYYLIAPAEDLFRAFMEAVKHDGFGVYENHDKTGLQRSYKTYRDTIVVTPTVGDCCHVESTSLYERNLDVIFDPLLFTFTVAYFNKIIYEKLLG